MQVGTYVGLSSQIAIERRLDTLADNVANSGTVGFRATRIQFHEALQGTGQDATAFVTEGKTYIDERSGGLTQTGNPLDFAVRGNGWFAVQTDAGMVLTRDGRFSLNPEGVLVNIDGDPVLDPGGAAIQLNPAGGGITAGKDGFLYQNGQLVGSLGLYTFEPGGDVNRYGASGIIPATPPVPVVDRPDIGAVQGFIEESNVDPVREMTRLIMLQRTFDSVATMIKDADSSLNSAVQLLGGK
ncbi:MAG: flagellar basal-body rod protein FlgF [Zhengella sp.]|uniref:flagellar basal-body rod protein FlgF n=1 Tax=Zhengella sp. TaxID=2282762 RepID=UPI003527C3DA|nr:flagellar basal-body rod protein FlgF [Brucellaceae bacterium]